MPPAGARRPDHGATGFLSPRADDARQILRADIRAGAEPDDADGPVPRLRRLHGRQAHVGVDREVDAAYLSSRLPHISRSTRDALLVRLSAMAEGQLLSDSIVELNPSAVNVQEVYKQLAILTLDPTTAQTSVRLESEQLFPYRLLVASSYAAATRASIAPSPKRLGWRTPISCRALHTAGSCRSTCESPSPIASRR